jgi:hypothetical protein
MQRFPAALQESQSHGSMIANFFVKCEKIIEAIDEAGQFAQLEMDKLKGSEQSRDFYESVVLTIANFILQLVVGTSKFVAERDSKSSPADECIV